MAGQLNHPFEEFLDKEERRYGRRDVREFAIGFDESHQAFPGRADGFQSAANVVVHLVVKGEERVAERRDGRDGVHDFVREDAGQAYPRVDFLLVQFAVDVVDGENADVLLLKRHFRDAHGQMDVAPFVCEGNLMLVARLKMPESLFQLWVDARQLAHMREDGKPQQAEGFVVLLVDVSVVVQYDNPRIDRVENQFVVFLPFGGVRLDLEEDAHDAVERFVDEAVVRRDVGRRVMENVITVVNRVKHERNLLRLSFVCVDYLSEQQHPQDKRHGKPFPQFIYGKKRPGDGKPAEKRQLDSEVLKQFAWHLEFVSFEFVV